MMPPYSRSSSLALGLMWYFLRSFAGMTIWPFASVLTVGMIKSSPSGVKQNLEKFNPSWLRLSRITDYGQMRSVEFGLRNGLRTRGVRVYEGTKVRQYGMRIAECGMDLKRKGVRRSESSAGSLVRGQEGSASHPRLPSRLFRRPSPSGAIVALWPQIGYPRT